VHELRKGLGGLFADSLGGAVRGDQVRMFGLQQPQLPLELVVLLVADLRPVLDVVEPLVPADLLPQLVDARRRPVAVRGLVAGANSREPG
jgi:hypothetical protein